MVLLHGAGGFADELFIVVLAFAVLWLTIRLNGKKRAKDDEDDDLDAETEPTPPAEDSSTSTPRP